MNLGGGLVVRIPGVFIGSDDGQIVGDEVLALEGFADPLAHTPLVPATVADAVSDLLESGGHDLVHGVAGGEVSGDLGVGERGLEARDQIGGGADLDAEAANQLKHSAIDQRDVHDVIVGRVLHGDALVRLEDGGQLLVQFAP